MSSTTTTSLPVIVIGAGPVGLAAAAHLVERGLEPLVLEAGDSVAAAVRQWAHVRLFSPWQFNVDAAARRLLEAEGWQEPAPKRLPTGGELVSDYLEPLARTAALQGRIVTGARVVAVSRDGLDKTHGRGRAERPFLVRATVDGEVVDYRAGAVIDASGTWSQTNPLGTAGLPAPGETDAASFLLGPLPDVLGRDRERAAGKHVVVVGAVHSAANTLLSLAQLRRAEPGTRVTWLVRGSSVERAYGGGDADGLPARGMLGSQLRRAVEAGEVELMASATITAMRPVGDRLELTLATREGERRLAVDAVAGATGFRPDLAMLRELRLDLDPGVEAPSRLAPLIDPEFHSCGTVPAHGADVLAHPEPDFYIAGMKSYGRAPTFLLATGYEQVRSIVAHLAGDSAAASTLELELPETGVCSTATPVVEADGSLSIAPEAAGDCCGAPAEPALIGFPTGFAHGRTAL
ncbi:NAD(P)-binding domain-containing protein [Georgenia sp. H159]|uniref:NAD(P)-binding domain-containing protein n=1 Tax=Georgenia sp. H159 TaxID=3076115 RepID=UPI002D783159|nr:NAD(P)-binding domain-containing protein [Georgenia sp. H159]